MVITPQLDFFLGFSYKEKNLWSHQLCDQFLKISIGCDFIKIKPTLDILSYHKFWDFFNSTMVLHILQMTFDNDVCFLIF